MAIGDDGDCVLVGAVGSNSILMSETVTNLLKEISKFGFGQFVRGFECVNVKYCVFLCGAVFRI